jgi:hypothetical protein
MATITVPTATAASAARRDVALARLATAFDRGPVTA